MTRPARLMAYGPREDVPRPWRHTAVPFTQASKPYINLPRGGSLPRHTPSPTRHLISMSQSPPIIYTRTDEAPALATRAFLPVVRAFAGATGVPVETRDISLAGRILAAFPDMLDEDQQVSDDLAELGRLVETPEANVIKLPNISASVPQMNACIAELRE
ncbi:MAG TPA: NADP-dependent isocitrate dehydrogenase, partial [Longimicrobiales bacterium]|nr:NADP-dependent isocitrate dehydrogenase [Longimicrobiales bacterium]